MISSVVSLASTGNDRREVWFENVPPKDTHSSTYLDHGRCTIAVALVPFTGGFLRLENPEALQDHLHRVAVHFRDISVVQQYRRNRLLCKSSSLECVSDSLACSVLANVPVEAFIPPNLACVKRVVRGVNSSLTPLKVLDLLSSAGFTSG